MSHSDYIKVLPTRGVSFASTHDVENAAFNIQGEETLRNTIFILKYYHSNDGNSYFEISS